MAAERAALYATPERVAEIERRQPEAESCGRVLFYRPGTPLARERKARARQTVEEVELEAILTSESPGWRKTFEFAGDEDALAESDTVENEEGAEELRIEAAA